MPTMKPTRRSHLFLRLSRRGLSPLAVLFTLAMMACVLSACSHPASLMDGIQKRGKLVAGVKYDSKPFGYLDTDGELKGFDIDLMRELARRILGRADAVEFRQVYSSTRIIAINSGNVDVVAATMTITPARRQVIDFSQPYFTAHQAVLVPAKSPVRRLSELNNKTILFVLGTTSEERIKRALPHARFIGFKGSTEALSALTAKQGDALTTDDTILSGFINEDCHLRMLDQKLSDEPYGLGFHQEENAENPTSLRSRINRALTDMQRDGTLKRLQDKWRIRTARQNSCK